MSRDLTNSAVDRQNILNNPYALEKIQTALDLPAWEFEGERLMTKQQVAEFFEVDERTVDRYLADHEEELRGSGYTLSRGIRLKNMRMHFAPDINVGSKTSQLGVFTLRAVLNLAMLLAESDRAKQLRAHMLDVVLDTIAERSGGQTKYINQRDRDYLPSAYLEGRHRKEFTSALGACVAMDNYKYAYFTDRVYQSIFKEKAREYRRVLRLEAGDKTRETMYAEVLTLVASFEAGLAHELTQEARRLGRKLSKREADQVFANLEAHPLWQPQLLTARTKMASRDAHFRDALHHRLEEFINAVPRDDFERFLDKTSLTLEERLIETRGVFERLKDR